MSLHYCPNDRPVHPECELARTEVCTCDDLWDFWDGTGESLDDHIKVARRNEGLRVPRLPPEGNETLGEYIEDVDEEDLSGFWKDSEFLDTLDY